MCVDGPLKLIQIKEAGPTHSCKTNGVKGDDGYFNVLSLRQLSVVWKHYVRVSTNLLHTHSGALITEKLALDLNSAFCALPFSSFLPHITFIGRF